MSRRREFGDRKTTPPKGKGGLHVSNRINMSELPPRYQDDPRFAVNDKIDPQVYQNTT